VPKWSNDYFAVVADNGTNIANTHWSLTHRSRTQPTFKIARLKVIVLLRQTNLGITFGKCLANCRDRGLATLWPNTLSYK
jgi:hypothetical protein